MPDLAAASAAVDLRDPALRKVVFLGPQRLAPMVGDVAERLGIVGKAAIITAGWQDREAEDGELRSALRLPGVNLRLHERWHQVEQEDPGLFAAHRRRQDQLRALEDLYDDRLRYTMDAAREMLAHRGPAALLDPERASAVAAVRALDNHHLQRVGEIHAAWHDEFDARRHPALQRQRAEVQDLLADCSVIAVAGGHVGVLLNRLRIFGLLDALWSKDVLAWSGGAMVLTERLVLFHDRPPQGAGNAEVFEHGLGLVRGVVCLPHARRRLDLQDPVRVALMARRLSPARAIAFDERSWLAYAAPRPTTSADAEQAREVLDGAPAAGDLARVLRASGRVSDFAEGFRQPGEDSDGAAIDPSLLPAETVANGASGDPVSAHSRRDRPPRPTADAGGLLADAGGAVHPEAATAAATRSRQRGAG